MKPTHKLAISSLLLAGAYVVPVHAQVVGGSEQKLFDMFVMGEFEKCADRAMKMTENDKTKYNSEPYLYVSMCMIKMNDDPELREYYPDALKDALKYGAKFKKRDDRLASKEQATLFEDNVEFIDELKELAIREGKGFFVQDDFRKAVYFYKLGKKLDMDDPAMQLMKGVGDLYSKNTREGITEVDAAMAKFEEMAKTGSFEANDRTYLAFEDGFYYYAKYLKEKGNRTKANEVVRLARELDPKNGKFERLQESMGG